MKPNMCRAGARKGKIKLKKRLLSILLAAVMVLTMLPLGLVDTAWAAEDWLWPAENCYIVSSNYGARDLYGTGNYDNYHRGIDIIGANGTLGKPIRAAKSGTIYSRNASIADNTYVAGSMGNYVAINHGDGTYSVYMHMRPNGVASTGTVRQGDIIGYIGNTGDSYGAHLHFQIYTNPNNMSGSTLNPMPTNGNITIQNRYVLPSGWASEKTTYVFEVQPPAHTCDRGSYQYYEAAHPHYKNYKCSICGEIWRDTSDPTLLATCDDCRPGKPALLNMRDSYETGEAVTFAWAGTSNTTHYNLWLERSIGNDKWENVEQIFYADNGLTRTFEAGEYRAQLLSYNSDLWETDRSDWVHTWSDDCFFTVKEPAPTSGSCGENLTWTLEENGTLTISGMGRMQDYSRWIDTPWYSIRSQIKSVIIKNGVTSIGNMAFGDCEALTEVTIPDSVIEIGWLAFDSCSSLKGVNIPNSVTYIGGYAFASCSSLTSVTIPDSVHTICKSAFEYCSSLTSVMIPDSVTSIDNGAFKGCSALTEIKLPSALRVIQSETFSNCVRLTSVTIPKSATYIGEKAFYYCDSLTDVYYDGTASDWAKITIEEGNEDLTNATLHCVKSAPAAPVVKIGNSASSGKPMLTWNAVYGATSYRIYRSTSKGSGYSLLGTTTATSYTNTGAKAGTTYYYRVKACNDAGLSAYSNIVSGQNKAVTPKPAAPVVKIGHSATSGKPMLTWNAVSGATSYKVYRATSQNGTYSLLGTVTTTSYTNTGAKAGTTYWYKVKAVNSVGESAYSNIVSGRATVTTLTMGHSSASGKPQLTWKAVSGAASYKVYRATAKNGAYSVINTTKALTYTNVGAALGTTYYYKVEALNAAGKSLGFSDVVEGKVAPVLAVGYSSVSGKPQLTWKAVPGATEYQVYRSTQQNSGYSKINTTTSTSYVNTGAKAGTTYYYRIVAVKGTAVSDFSNIVSARPGK